jgi:hypothetical protein
MKYTDFNETMRVPVFSRQDLKLFGVKVFDYQLSLWQKQGRIVKLRNGLYLLRKALASVMVEELAGQIYAPSYISLEKALSYYGIIPEMVYAITSVTPKTTRKFNNKLGAFFYRHVKRSLFFGYRVIKGQSSSYLLAEPEKALLDFIYFNRGKLKTSADFDALRFNRRAIAKAISRPQLKRYLSAYNDDKIADICQKVMGERGC